MKRDYYDVLRINKKAKPAQIKKAYRTAAKRHHPDVSPRGEEKFKEIQEAYETLSDPAKRARYDRRDQEVPYYQTARGGGEPFRFSYDLFGGIEDLLASFGDFWIDDRPDIWATNHRASYRSVEIILTPAEARNGCRIPLTIRSLANCTRCRGRGNTGGLICGLCRGQGRRERETTVELDISPGVRNGMETTISLRGTDSGEFDLDIIFKVSRS
jgi:molecular chaperone DnaJ